MRATRHGYLYARTCAAALALLLGATLAAAPPAAAQANHLKVALQGDTSNVDLHLTTHYVSRVALLNVYEMLYTLGEDLSIQPMLADKQTVSPDGLVYTITIRKGVKFHNGKVMDAKDVACARPGCDARTRTSCQFCPQLGPQRQAVPRGYVDSTNQHRHPTPRSDHADEFGKLEVGVDLVQHCARQS